MGRECLGYRALQELGRGTPEHYTLDLLSVYPPVSLSQFPNFSDSHNTKWGIGLCRCLWKGWVVFQTSREGLCFNDQPRAGYRNQHSETCSWGRVSQRHISGGQGDNVGSRKQLMWAKGIMDRGGAHNPIGGLYSMAMAYVLHVWVCSFSSAPLVLSSVFSLH